MKKFRKWLEKNPLYHQFQTKQFLSDQVELSQDFFTLKDGAVLSVRIADSYDVRDIVAIQKKCYDGETPWHSRALNNELSMNRNALYLIMHEEETPVAFIGAWFVENESHITNVGTIPEYERQGIASFLLKEIIKIARDENFDILTLEVRVSNKKAQSLYRTLGFKDVKVKKGYYTNDHEDALDMLFIL